MSEWQPIATGPQRPGVMVLLWWPTRFHAATDGWWNGDYWCADSYDSYARPLDQPTHWMPLPDPPTPETEPPA